MAKVLLLTWIRGGSTRREDAGGVRRFRFRFPIYDFDVFLSPLDNTSSMVKVFGYGSNSSRDRS